MSDNRFLTAIEGFLADPGPSALRMVLDASEPFVVAQARRWAASRLPFADRCRELLAEMFLILVEQIRIERVSRPQSVLSYLSLRLRRLTRPSRQKETPLGLGNELDARGRACFTPARLSLVTSLVAAVRRALTTDPHRETRRLETLFLHVRPELAWASRHLAVGSASHAMQRYEVDKKRHQSFCRSLRSAFEDISYGDWQEVFEWSAGERSHLAWSIISLADWELHGMADHDPPSLARWRDHDAPPDGSSVAGVALIDRLIDHLTRVYDAIRCGEQDPSRYCRPCLPTVSSDGQAGKPWLVCDAPHSGLGRSTSASRMAKPFLAPRPSPAAPLVQESAAPYGNQGSEAWFEHLLEPVLVRSGAIVAEEHQEWEESSQGTVLPPTPEEQKAFRGVCQTLSSWADSILSARRMLPAKGVSNDFSLTPMADVDAREPSRPISPRPPRRPNFRKRKKLS